MKLLITGATGYIGKHVVRQALAEGHSVRASLRDPARAGEVRAAVGDGPLECVALDLMSDEGWDAACAGMDAVLHTASPVPIGSPRHAEDVIRPAVDGTLRAVEAAGRAGVGRIVVTSSIAAILNGAPKPGGQYGAEDWSDPERADMRAYSRSKTLAERAARDRAATVPGLSLVTVNPGFVFGPPLDAQYGSSIALIERLYRGTDPLLPRLSFPCVDVRDVAEAHLRALEAEDGARILASHSTFWLSEMAALVRQAPGARASRREAPDWLVRAVGRVVPVIGQVTSDLGQFKTTDPATMIAALGRAPHPPADAIVETARFIAALRG